MHDAGSLSLSDSNVVDESQVADSLTQMRGAQDKILEQLGKLIVGQEEVVNQLLICLFVGGHSLITGLPGLAKDPPGSQSFPDSGLVLQPDSIYSGLDAGRHHWNRNH